MISVKKRREIKVFLVTASIGIVVLGGQQVLADAASEMVNPKDKVLVGYWHNWKSTGKDGYKGGSSADFNLSSTQEGYNVINVSFMKTPEGQTLPTFKPYNKTDTEFRAEISKLNAEGKSVLIALGGADAHIELKKSQETDFVNEIIRLVDTYGFDGLDIDLEQAAIEAADNQTVIPSALKKVKDHYRKDGKNFMITMAPEFPYLTSSGKYAPYINNLDSYYDFINPQYYNQGGDGFWDSDLNMWISQSNDEKKEDFLYGLTQRLVTGTDGFIKIPASKFVIGLPSNNDAAATGYVKDPNAVKNALNRLKASGNEIKGLMTWSVNWDAGTNSNGEKYNNTFVNTYAPMLFNNQPIEDTEKPTLPTISISNVTASTATIQGKSTDNVRIDHYEIKIGTQSFKSTSGLQDVTGLSKKTEYNVEVVAVDPSGNRSDTARATFMTLDTSAENNTWQKDKVYVQGDRVTFNGVNYEAKWWNTGQLPDQSGDFGPWKKL